jgi:hypothetical protein
MREDQEVGQTVVADVLGRVGREGRGRRENLEDLLRTSVGRQRLLRSWDRLALALEEPGLERITDNAARDLGLLLDRCA